MFVELYNCSKYFVCIEVTFPYDSFSDVRLLLESKYFDLVDIRGASGKNTCLRKALQRFHLNFLLYLRTILRLISNAQRFSTEVIMIVAEVFIIDAFDLCPKSKFFCRILH